MKKIISFEEKYNLLTGRIFLSATRFLNQNFKNSLVEITKEQWTVLAALWRKDGVSQQSIADQTGRDKPSTTRLIDNLEKLGYLDRKPAPDDRRSNLIFLTEKGRVMQQEVESIVDGTIEKMTSGISEKELQTVRNVFKKIYINIENE